MELNQLNNTSIANNNEYNQGFIPYNYSNYSMYPESPWNNTLSVKTWKMNQ